MDLGGREDLLRRLTRFADDPDAPASVLVTHHVEELPPGISHVLLLRDGAVVAAEPGAEPKALRETGRSSSEEDANVPLIAAAGSHGQRIVLKQAVGSGLQASGFRL